MLGWINSVDKGGASSVTPLFEYVYALKNHVLNDPHIHNNDVIMGAMASQITSRTIVYSTVYSGADQGKHQSSASLAFVRGIHRDRWIPRTNGQYTRKYFHLMTSSCPTPLWIHFNLILFKIWYFHSSMHIWIYHVWIICRFLAVTDKEASMNFVNKSAMLLKRTKQYVSVSVRKNKISLFEQYT